MEKHNLSRGFALVFNQAVKMIVAMGVLPKVSVFADFVGETEQIVNKKLNGLTPFDSLDEIRHWAAVIKRLEPATVYPWLVCQIFMDMEI